MKSITEACKPVQRPEKILQFGEGNFLRAFVDWMVDIGNEKTDFNGNVVMVQPLENGMAGMINDQNGLYTTVLRGVQNGQTVSELRTINSVSRCIQAYAEYDTYMDLSKSEDLEFVVSNTTEAGISYNPADKLEDKPQASFPGKVTAFLYNRFKHFNGAKGKGLVFIPCELIDKNGDKLKEIVLQYASEWKLEGAFIDWINEECDFCNSLVDRIVPGYPRDEADALCTELGYKDNLLCAAEIFHLWVIETKKDHSKKLPLADAGLNVIWTDDMSFYRTRKVRILNGAHTMTVPAAFQYGLDTVEDCIKDETMYAFMKKGIFEEIIPSMDGDEKQLIAYANDVLERFANPYIKHFLLSITLNSVSKFKTRDLPSITGYIKKNAKVPATLAFSIAALISFYESSKVDGDTMEGNRNGSAYTIKDDVPVMETFVALYKKASDMNPAEKAAFCAKEVLSNTTWWAEDLTAYAGLEQAVASALESIWSKGMNSAVKAL